MMPTSNVVFTSEVLPYICLVNHNYLGWVQISALLCRFHTHTESEWDIRYAENNDSGICWCVFCNSCEVAFKNVISVEERLFTVWFHPDLVFAVFCEIIKTSDIELELA